MGIYLLNRGGGVNLTAEFVLCVDFSFYDFFGIIHWIVLLKPTDWNFTMYGISVFMTFLESV